MEVVNYSLDQILTAFNDKRKFFDSGQTRPYKFRKAALENLLAKIKKYQPELLEAMQKDYKKPKAEGYIGDIGVVIQDLKHTLKNLKSWMDNKHISTPITVQPAGSYIMYEPKGVVVIFGPWNYPFNLVMTPLIGAIAAGNCAILKPAHETPNTCVVIAKLIEEAFDDHYISVVTGQGKTMGELLLDHCTFNHIFFTGSAKTGKWIMEKAARTLSPVTLELGGKCPSIIDATARLHTSVQRIIWSKFFNAGQTCLSTDYVLVHESIKEAFIAKAKEVLHTFYGPDIKHSPHYCRIVNVERFKKITSYLDQGKILFGGDKDEADCYLEPTILEIDNLELPIMSEEIFGPILPVITWKTLEDVVNIVRKNRYPLACYVFSENQDNIRFFLSQIEFGGGCINDAITHYGNSNLPFGGVMSSGMGKYHGRHSFEVFSNAKSILNSVSLFDAHLWYPPYTPLKGKIIETVVG